MNDTNSNLEEDSTNLIDMSDEEFMLFNKFVEESTHTNSLDKLSDIQDEFKLNRLIHE